MARRVDADGEAAGNPEPEPRELACERMRRLPTGRRGPAAAHHSELMTSQNAHITLDKEHERRVGNMSQERRIRFAGEREDLPPGSLAPTQIGSDRASGVREPQGTENLLGGNGAGDQRREGFARKR